MKTKPKYKTVTKKDLAKANATHKVWHKFSKWMTDKYGKDLYGKWQTMKFKDKDGKKHSLKHRSFNDYELSKRISGYEVICAVEKFIKRSCPEIKIVHCDDDVYAGSIILLIPHPKMGISVMFIPQCTGIQNRFFLYDTHFKMLISELKKMSYVYKNQL